jgi:hypothetical protein
MGIAPTAHTAVELEVKTIAAELIAKEILIREQLKERGVDLLCCSAVKQELFENGEGKMVMKADYDNYWSLVSYYINKQSLGKTYSRISQEIMENLNGMRKLIDVFPSLNPLLDGFDRRTTELTGRQDSSKIKQLLDDAEKPAQMEDMASKYRMTSNMDVVLATNMISVGIDISRWNLINMVGQPLTTAEYIQSSSRVGRKHDGLVVSLYNPLKNRELSYYEKIYIKNEKMSKS